MLVTLHVASSLLGIGVERVHLSFQHFRSSVNVLSANVSLMYTSMMNPGIVVICQILIANVKLILTGNGPV